MSDCKHGKYVLNCAECKADALNSKSCSECDMDEHDCLCGIKKDARLGGIKKGLEMAAEYLKCFCGEQGLDGCSVCEYKAELIELAKEIK